MFRYSIVSSHTAIVIALTLLLHAWSQNLSPSYVFAKSASPHHALASTATLDENVSSNERQPQSMPVVRLKATLAGHTKSITEIAFSPDGETIATGSEDGTVRLWSARIGKQKALIVGAEKYAWVQLIWSPDGRKLATTISRNRDENRKTQVWNAGTGELKATLDAENSRGYISAWSPDGRTVLTESSDGTAKLWDAETGRLKATFEQEPPLLKETDSFLKSVLKGQRLFDESFVHGYFDASGQTILTTSYHQPPKLWNAATAELKTILKRADTTPDKSYHYYLGDLLLSPDKHLIVWRDSSSSMLLDTSTGQPKYTLGDIGRLVSFSPDGRTILTIKRHDTVRLRGNSDQLYLRDVATGQIRLAFEKIPEGADRFFWSPQGETIVVIGDGRTMTRLLDAYTGRAKARLPYQGCVPDTLFGSSGCEPFIFSADGRVLLKLKETLKLWSANTGELIAALGSAHLPAAFSPMDRSLLATRGRDRKTLLLWEVAIK